MRSIFTSTKKCGWRKPHKGCSSAKRTPDCGFLNPEPPNRRR